MRLLILLFLFMPAMSSACSCYYTETFCEYTKNFFEWTEGETVVVRARFKAFRTPDVNGYAPLFDFVILEVIAGEIDAPIVSLWGQDGGNCNGPIMQLTEGDEYMVMFSSRPGYSTYYGGLADGIENPYPIHDFPGCGPATLSIRGATVTGAIAPGISTISTIRFRQQLAECVGEEVIVKPEYPLLPVYEVTVSPNPARESFTVAFTVPAPVLQVSLYDMLGRLISREQLNGALISSHEVIIEKLPAGVYVLVMETDGIRVKKQVVKY